MYYFSLFYIGPWYLKTFSDNEYNSDVLKRSKVFCNNFVSIISTMIILYQLHFPRNGIVGEHYI